MQNEEGGVANDGISAPSREGGEGHADESVSGGSAASGNTLPFTMDKGPSSHEYEYFLSQLLGDEPDRGKRHKEKRLMNYRGTRHKGWGRRI